MEKKAAPASQPCRNAAAGEAPRADLKRGIRAAKASHPQSARGKERARAIPESSAAISGSRLSVRLMQQDAQDLADVDASRQRGAHRGDAERRQPAAGLLLAPAARRSPGWREVGRPEGQELPHSHD